MTSSNRREFLTQAAALIAASGLPVPALAQAKPKLVVVGGGPGGATIAKYVARDSNGAVEVTLVEPLRQFITCFHSNLYLGGFRGWESMLHSYDALASKYGVKLVHQAAQAIDRDKKSVRLADGTQLAYDRLVVAPGIDLKFEFGPGLFRGGCADHAARLEAGAADPVAQAAARRGRGRRGHRDGRPTQSLPLPSRPYERASMMAHVLKAKGHRNSRIIILDPKDTFSKQALFQEGWEKHYPGMVEWQDPKMHGGIKRVDASAMTVDTDLASYKAALINVIPAQMAGKIARDAGLANQTGYCPIDPASMKSANDPNIYVVGDACIAGDMPKSAFSANSQAKVAALMLRGELIQAQTFPARYTNTCWSLIETDDTVKVGGRYEPKEGKIAAVETFVSKTGENAELRRQTQAENMGWYAGITADIFS